MTIKTALLIGSTFACAANDGNILDPLGGPVVRIELRAGTDSLFRPGETARVLATLFDRSGHDVVRAVSITWHSTDSTVLTVDGTGMVTAAGNGSASVIARVEGVDGRTSISVSFGPPLASIGFADGNLAACVAEVRLTYANQVQQLRCPGREIASLAGIEALKRLNVLDLGSTNVSAMRNNIRDLQPLSSLHQLRNLYLGGNRVADIRALGGLNNLSVLDLSLNEIVDISPLSGLVFLRDLYLDRNRIADLRPLAPLIRVKWLGLGDNGIIDVGPLGSLRELDILVLRGNQIADIRPLRTLTALRDLELASNRITDLSTLGALANLRSLALSRNPFPASALSVLHSLPALSALSLIEVALNDASPLAGLTRLQWLSIQKSNLSNITALGTLTALQSLYLDDNLITDVRPLAALTELQQLWLSRNHITTGVAALVTLTKARAIQLSGNTGIRCAELAVLRAALGPNVVGSSGNCVP